MRILTWHVHGNYLLDLTQIPHEFWVPFKPGRPHPYGGRSGDFPWPDNLHELSADEVRHETFDWVIFQSRGAYLNDQHELLSDAQRRGPRLYIEHDPPLTHPFAERHPIDDPEVTIVHVTSWNALMWDTGRSPTHVIEHGVRLPMAAQYSGEIARGVTAINNLHERGRRMGADLFDRIRSVVPLDLVGLGTEPFGGLGPIPTAELAPFMARYRFFFSPVRQTSLSLAMIEAMMAGLPVVGLATGEMTTVIQNGVSGYIDTSVDRVIDAAHTLLHDADLARRLGDGARRTACARFAIDRFADDWNALLHSGSASRG